MMAKANLFAKWLDGAIGSGIVRPSVALTVAGEHEAIQAVRQLPGKVATRVFRAALKKSLQPGEIAAKAAATRIRNPKRRIGVNLSETLKNKIKTYKNSDVLYGMIGFSAPHSWLVEHGHRMVVGGAVRRINKARLDYGVAGSGRGKTNYDRGRVVGRVPAYPFMADAMRPVTGEMAAIFIREVEAGTARALKRMAKEAAKAGKP